MPLRSSSPSFQVSVSVSLKTSARGMDDAEKVRQFADGNSDETGTSVVSEGNSLKSFAHVDSTSFLLVPQKIKIKN